jgi:acetolactate synthase I/II/III large subunit
MTVMTTGRVIADSLVAHGVDTVFGIPGAHTYDLIDALAQRGKELRFIATRHEQGAAYMAYGYAKATGRIGVFTVVPGPGVLNAGAALCTAYGATAPLLCLTGNIQAHLIGQGRGQLHELPDQLALLRGITKWSERINHPTEAGAVMAEAFRQLKSGRVRPVAVETPWNVFGMSAEVHPVWPLPVAPPPPPDPSALAAASRLIAAARRPLIMVGAGALDAAGPVRELARLLQAPVTAHRSGKGIVGEDLPYGLSPVAAWEYWRDCDLLLGIGSRLELQYLRWRWFPKSLRVVRVDIDPTEMVRLRPEVGLVTDSAVGTRALIDALRPLVGTRASREAEFDGLKQRARSAIQTVKPQVEYLEVIREVLPRDGYFCEEISQVGFAARFAFPVYEPRHYLTCGYQDNLGFGFNTALGAKVAMPDRPVISVSGDGGFLFGVQELATAVQYGIGLVSIVFNNSGYGNVRRDQQEKYAGRYLGVELRNPDFCALAESFGALGLRASSPGELRPVLQRALGERRPVVIEVSCAPGSEASPWSFLHPAPPG